MTYETLRCENANENRLDECGKPVFVILIELSSYRIVDISKFPSNETACQTCERRKQDGADTHDVRPAYRGVLLLCLDCLLHGHYPCAEA